MTIECLECGYQITRDEDKLIISVSPCNQHRPLFEEPQALCRNNIKKEKKHDHPRSV